MQVQQSECGLVMAVFPEAEDGDLSRGRRWRVEIEYSQERVPKKNEDIQATDKDRGYSKRGELLSWYYDVVVVVMLLVVVAAS